MKKRNLITMLILATLLQTANAQEQLCGEPTFEKDTTQAKRIAANSLNERINSVTSGHSESKIEMVGTQATQKFTSKSTLTTKDSLAYHNITFPKGESKQGKHITACISLENAYRPYLNKLDSLVRKLRELNQKQDEKSCQDINETYNSINKLAEVLNTPNISNTQIQAKYDSLKREYQTNSKSGIYLEIDENILGEKSEVLETKLKEVLGDRKCRIIEQNKCKTTGGYTLKVKAKTEIDRTTNTINWCKANAKIELFDSKNDKVREASGDTLGTFMDKVRACEVAFKYLAPKIYNKVESNIGEVCR